MQGGRGGGDVEAKGKVEQMGDERGWGKGASQVTHVWSASHYSHQFLSSGPGTLLTTE